MRIRRLQSFSLASPLVMAIARQRSFCYVFRVRLFATHREATSPSSLLSQALDQRQRAANNRSSESVGPFQLGLMPPTARDQPPQKKWSELNTSGKVIRTTARTTNLTVILLGAGLFVVLGYALTSELFSRNSPTVLYGRACELIQASSGVTNHLRPPLVFHNNPPSSIRPRHRNRHVSSYVAVDSTGREHMFLNFYVEGSSGRQDPSSLTSVTSSISSLNMADVQNWCRDIWQASKGIFRYLSGNSPPTSAPTPALSEPWPAASGPSKGSHNTSWSFMGLFSGLRGLQNSAAATNHVPATDTNNWTDGEVYAELVRNDEGYFKFRKLLVELPNSRVRNPVRLWVYRAPDVRDNEPIMRFTAS